MSIVESRLPTLEEITLTIGSHSDFEAGVCVMEMASHLAGEPFSDRPKCVSPVLTSLLMRFNDGTDDAGREALKPFIPKVIGTRDDGFDELRGWLISDWAIRVATPTWLELAGITESAAFLRGLDPIHSRAEYRKSQGREIREECWARRSDWRAKIREAVKAEFAKRGLTATVKAAADIAAAAAIAADIAAAAAATATADIAIATAATATTYNEVWQAVYDRVKPIYAEKLGPTSESLKGSFFEMVEVLVDPVKLAELAA